MCLWATALPNVLVGNCFAACADVLVGNCFAECACGQLLRRLWFWATALPNVLVGYCFTACACGQLLCKYVFVGNCLATCACGQLYGHMCLWATAWPNVLVRNCFIMASVQAIWCNAVCHFSPFSQNALHNTGWNPHLIGQTYWEPYSYSIVSISVLTHTGDFSAISQQEIIWSEKS